MDPDLPRADVDADPEHSRANLARRLGDVFEFFGEMKMAEVEPQDIKAFAAWGRGAAAAGEALPGRSAAAVDETRCG